MSVGANGRDWSTMHPAELMNVDPTSEYVPADAQLLSTTGEHIAQFQSDDRETVREVDDATTRNVIDALDRPRKVGAVKINQNGRRIRLGKTPMPDDYLPKFENDGGPALPSFGEEEDDCGDDLAMFCDCCGETKVMSRTCSLSRCPRCWASWCRKQAVKKAAKLTVCRAVRDANREDQQYFHHLAWSPPKEWALQSEDTLKRTKQALNEILDAMDLEGFGVYHAWRGKQDDDDLNEWKKRIGQNRSWDDVRDELEFSPHFHMIVVGAFVPGQELSKRVEEETGWVLNRITKGENSKVSLYDNLDMVAATMYCLSHASLKRTPAGHNSVQAWYHGDLMEKITDTDTPGTLDIPDATYDEMDLLSRAKSAHTLGIDLDSVLCTDERVILPNEETGADRAGVRSLIDLGTGDSRTWTPSPSDFDGSDFDGSETWDAGGTATEIDSIEHSRESEGELERRKCEGRLLHIGKAPKYLGNDEWRENAAYADRLQATWQEWKDRLPELGLS